LTLEGTKLSLVLEAGEVMEHFQWKKESDIDSYIKEHKEEIGEELADVLYWVLLMSQDFEIDIIDAIKNKLEKNKLKYPVEKSRGKSNKYNEL
jgi:NTP pyrophosphatase (non-canonical NTP hydrolase)